MTSSQRLLKARFLNRRPLIGDHYLIYYKQCYDAYMCVCVGVCVCVCARARVKLYNDDDNDDDDKDDDF